MILVLYFDPELFVDISGGLVKQIELVFDDDIVIELLPGPEGDVGVEGVEGEVEIVNGYVAGEGPVDEVGYAVVGVGCGELPVVVVLQLLLALRIWVLIIQVIRQINDPFLAGDIDHLGVEFEYQIIDNIIFQHPVLPLNKHLVFLLFHFHFFLPPEFFDMWLGNIGDNGGVYVEFAQNLQLLKINFDNLSEVAVDVDG